MLWSPLGPRAGSGRSTKRSPKLIRADDASLLLGDPDSTHPKSALRRLAATIDASTVHASTHRLQMQSSDSRSWLIPRLRPLVWRGSSRNGSARRGARLPSGRGAEPDRRNRRACVCADFTFSRRGSRRAAANQERNGTLIGDAPIARSRSRENVNHFGICRSIR